MHQSSLKFDNHSALVISTSSPGAAQVHQLFTLVAPSALEHIMADAYLAEVLTPDLDIESDTCTVDDIALGIQSNDNTESKSAEQRSNQGTDGCTDNTTSTSKRATERANQSTGGCAQGAETRKLCRGNSLRVLQLYFDTMSLALPFGHASGTTLLDCDGRVAPLSLWVPQ